MSATTLLEVDMPVKIHEDHYAYPLRTGKIKRLCKPPFEEYAYVTLDKKQREKTEKTAMILISQISIIKL